MVADFVLGVKVIKEFVNVSWRSPDGGGKDVAKWVNEHLCLKRRFWELVVDIWLEAAVDLM